MTGWIRAILYIIDSSRNCAEEERLITELLEGHQDKIVINKIDGPYVLREHVRKFIKANLPKMCLKL